MTFKGLADEFGAAKLWIGLIVVGTLSLNGVVQFLKDAPAIVNQNTAHVEAHHDTIVDLSEATEVFQARFIEDDSITHEQAARLDKIDLNLDYLVCLRTERARELDSLPPTRNCEGALLGR